jgi:hypothetical protein
VPAAEERLTEGAREEGSCWLMCQIQPATKDIKLPTCDNKILPALQQAEGLTKSQSHMHTVPPLTHKTH